MDYFPNYTYACKTAFGAILSMMFANSYLKV